MKWEDELPAGQARGSVKGGDRKFNCSDGYKKVAQFEVLYSVKKFSEQFSISLLENTLGSSLQRRVSRPTA
jgi:hypothetical protein